MKKSNLKPQLGVLFIMAVMIPSVILSIIAVRSLSREEAYIEKRMHDTLLFEITNAASVINGELTVIQRELSSSLSLKPDEPDYSLPAWSRKSAFVEIPFLVSDTGEILWPKQDVNLNKKEKAFIEWGGQFFQNEVRVPVYENVALAYKSEIAKESKKSIPAVFGLSRSERSIETMGSSSAVVSDKKDYEEPGEQYANQQAVTSFEKSVPLRQKIYEQAKQTGKQVAFRKVQVAKDQQTSQALQEESIFVSEPLTFGQIISKSNSGMIPRFANEDLKLLFWKKTNNGQVAGCVINQNVFKDRIIGVLPPIYSSARILTVLDQNGKPLITPSDNNGINWQRPFVAKEISPLLPHWEVAAYLTDPHMVSTEARSAMFIMWILISILFISISTGGFMVLRSLSSEMALARQKTTFVTNVSHELKTPLTSIKMFAEMLKERRHPDEAKKEKYLDLMVSETDRLTRLINNVLDFSRMEQGKKQYIFKAENIVSLCKELIEGQRLRLENNGFVVNFVTDSNEIILKVDAEAIKQAIINLIANAEKYSGDNKNVDLEIAHDAENVYLRIKDKGKGVPAAESKKIFEEFYRVDDSLTARVKGTGLGLTIALRIAKDHGGDIKYELREGGGSIFTIMLPLRARS